MKKLAADGGSSRNAEVEGADSNTDGNAEKKSDEAQTLKSR